MARRTQAFGTPAYRQTWRVVEGAIADTIKKHPEYLTGAGRKWLAESLTKRIVGQVVSYAEALDHASAKSRPGGSPAAEMGSDVSSVACGCLLVDGATTRTGRVLRALRTLCTLGGY